MRQSPALKRAKSGARNSARRGCAITIVTILSITIVILPLPRAKQIALLPSAGIGTVPSVGLKGGNLAPQAHVTLAAARATALAARPGVITDQELEREGGGSGLRYSFDIRSQGKTFEVGVDAVTGRVLENGVEGPHAD